MGMTRWRRLNRHQALGVLCLVAASIVLLLWIAAAAPPPVANTTGNNDGDLALFQRIIQHMRDGAGYYDAAHHELVTSGYGTQSVFNWRLPGLAWFWSALPSLQFGQWVLIAFAVVAANVIGRLFYLQGGLRLAVPGALVMILSLAGAFTPGTVLLSELTAGLLILLSVGLYGLGWRRTGLAVGALALVAREFAGLYFLVCFWLAWRNRRWSELAAWAAVLVAYGIYFAWHAWQVHQRVTGGDPGYGEGWIQFGGLGFVLATAAFNGFFALLPSMAHAVLVPLALLGLFAWPGETGIRASLTVLGTMAVFAIIGKPFNAYWGLIYTPLLSLGLAWVPFAVTDLSRAAFGNADGKSHSP